MQKQNGSGTGKTLSYIIFLIITSFMVSMFLVVAATAALISQWYRFAETVAIMVESWWVLAMFVLIIFATMIGFLLNRDRE